MWLETKLAAYVAWYPDFAVFRHFRICHDIIPFSLEAMDYFILDLSKYYHTSWEQEMTGIEKRSHSLKIEIGPNARAAASRLRSLSVGVKNAALHAAAARLRAERALLKAENAKD